MASILDDSELIDMMRETLIEEGRVCPFCRRKLKEESEVKAIMAMREKTKYNCNLKPPFLMKKGRIPFHFSPGPTISEVSVGKGKRKL